MVTHDVRLVAEINVLELLGKYLDHVGMCTGRVFLREIPPDRNGKIAEDWSNVVFTDEESELLHRLAGIWVDG